MNRGCGNSLIIFFVAELLEIQDGFAKDVLLYLQVLDPGRTWRKSQIVAKLRAITTALAKVSDTKKFSFFLVLSKVPLFQMRSDQKEMDAKSLKNTLMTIQDYTVALDKLK